MNIIIELLIIYTKQCNCFYTHTDLYVNIHSTFYVGWFILFVSSAYSLHFHELMNFIYFKLFNLSFITQELSTRSRIITTHT